MLYRPESNGPGLLDVIRGEALELHGLADLPLDEPGPGLPRHDLLALIPYRQIAERGFEALDDGTPLLALKVLGRNCCRWSRPWRCCRTRRWN